MNKKKDHTIPLNELLSVLHSNGYELTIEQVLDIQNALLSTSLSRLHTAELKYIITPIIAKNDEEQHDLYSIIDNWVAEKTTAAERAPNRLQRWMKDHFKMVFAMKVALLLFVVAAAIMLYVFTAAHLNLQDTRVAHGNVKPNITNRADIDSLTKNTAPDQALKPKSTVPNTQKTTPATSTVPEVKLDYVIESQQPIQPAKVDNRLPIALVFGFVLGAILFHSISYERRKRMELDKRKRAEEAVFTIPEKDNPNAVYPFNETDKLQHLHLQFSDKDYLIHRPGLLQKVKHILQLPVYVENPAINIKATIHKTVHSGGFTTIVSESDWKERKYIFLCDNNQPDAHITALLSYVVKQLKSSNPNVSWYQYTNDILQLKDNNGRDITLAQLAYLYPHYHIIVTGNCHAFFEPGTGLKEEIKELLVQWDSRSIITPAPIPDWSDKELQLQDSGFHLIPPDIEAIELLARAITEDTGIKNQLLQHRLKQVYPITAYDFRYIDQLKAYLNDEQLFQAVCSLAVYPFLQWPITLSLFAAFEKSWSGFTVSYDRLLKIARIPWLNSMQLDPSIRLQLLDALDAKTETIARETIIRLLDEMKPQTDRDSMAWSELKVQYNINAFFLYYRDQLKYKQFAGVKEVIGHYWSILDEWALKEHVNRQQSGLIPGSQVKATTSVEEFVVQEKMYEKLNIRLTKLSVLVLPATLLFIVFTIFKPAIVYSEDTGQKVSVAVIIQKDALCRWHLARAVLDNDYVSASAALGSDRLTDTIRLSEIRYDSHLRLQLYSKQGPVYTMSVPANYAVSNIKTNCQ